MQLNFNGDTLTLSIPTDGYDDYYDDYQLYYGRSLTISNSGLIWQKVAEQAYTYDEASNQIIFTANIPRPFSPYTFLHFKVKYLHYGEEADEVFWLDNLTAYISDTRYTQTYVAGQPCETYVEGRKSLMSVSKVNKKLSLLMIGSSFCYYYVKELVALAATIGIDLTVGNIYKSGCSITEYAARIPGGANQDEAYFKLYITDKNGRSAVKSTATTLLDCLNYKLDWDVVTVQHHFGGATILTDESIIITNAKTVLDFLKTKFPNAYFGWQEEWAYEVGHSKISSKEAQEKSYQLIQKISKQISEENNLFYIPSGDAWQYARQSNLVGNNLNRRILGAGFTVLTGTGEGDYYHDGDIGGGRYLNACTWFETLFGRSCIGNAYRPEYPVNDAADLNQDYNKMNSSDSDANEEYIRILQEAAHKAVLLM